MNTDTATPQFEVIIRHTVDDERVRNLLVSAFEGGSNYWYMIESHQYGGDYTARDFTVGHSMYNEEYPGMDHYLLPFVPGCAVIITDHCGESDKTTKKRYRLNRTALQRGLKLMAEKHPQHWQDFMYEQDDAGTADLFLQLCLFGDVIYG